MEIPADPQLDGGTLQFEIARQRFFLPIDGRAGLLQGPLRGGYAGYVALLLLIDEFPSLNRMATGSSLPSIS